MKTPSATKDEVARISASEGIAIVEIDLFLTSEKIMAASKLTGDWSRTNAPRQVAAADLTRGDVVLCRNEASGESSLAVVWSTPVPRGDDLVVAVAVPVLYRALGAPMPMRFDASKQVDIATRRSLRGAVLKVDDQAALVAGDEPPFTLVRVSLTDTTATQVATALADSGRNEMVLLHFSVVGYEDATYFVEQPGLSLELVPVDQSDEADPADPDTVASAGD